ncbi:MAG: gliding motility-associated C-terminal domain-containing protein, partial [Bacteroidia bacterium]
IEGAIDLGVLPLPPGCPVGDEGSTVSINGTTYSATGDNRFVASGGCFSGNSYDVWYRFTAVSNYTHIKLTATSPSPTFDSCYLRIWVRNGANSNIYQQLPLNCLSSDVGVIDQDIYTSAGGTEYYIEIGGQTTEDTGSFVLELTADLECDDCVQRAKIQMTPEPLFGIYGLGQNIKMCATIADWDYSASSLPQYIGPAALGTDWNLTTLVQGTAPGVGWTWMNTATNPNVSFTGYYYDPDNDLDPTNNAGDPSIAPFVNLTGCGFVETNPSCNTNDLSVLIKIYSDQVIGGGDLSNICDAGDNNLIDLHNQCCRAPQIAFVKPTCINPNSGQIAILNGLIAGNDSVRFVLHGQNFPNPVDSITNTNGSHVFSNLISGDYAVQTIQFGANSCTTFVSVHLAAIMEISLAQIGAGCTSGTGSATVLINNSSLNPLVQWYVNSVLVATGDTATGLPSGPVVCIVTDVTINCTLVDTIQIVNNTPPLVLFSYTNNQVCSTVATVSVQQQPNIAGGTYNLLSPPLSSGVAINTISGDISLVSSTAALPYWVIISYDVTDAITGCSVSALDSFFVVEKPPIPILTVTSPVSVCVGGTVPTLGVQQSSAYDVIWLDQQTSAVTFAPIYVPNVSTTQSGTYNFVVALSTDAVTGCASDPFLFTVNVNGLPSIQVTSDTTICPGDTITAQVNTTAPNVSVLWSPAPASGSATSSTVQLSNFIPQTYQVTLTDLSSSCVSSGSITVNVDTAGCESFNESFDTYSGFTPNGDGFNDAWVIDGITGIDGIQVQIFNRWGVRVWSSDQYDNTTNVWRGTGLNGELLPDGTYFYLIRNNRAIKKGWIELTR